MQSDVQQSESVGAGFIARLKNNVEYFFAGFVYNTMKHRNPK